MATPNFNKTLGEILDELKPHTRTCKQCQANFDVLAEDIEMYKKLQVPAPTLCWECRKQRRYGFYNNILKFYKKECAAHPGESVITTFPPNSPYKIFDLSYWWSDKWGAEDYGREYYFNKSFFEQFQELNLTVPHPAITHYWKGVINSPYSISIIESKNCYFSSVAAHIENVHYSYWVGSSRDSLDCLNSGNCENSYELVNCDKCYNGEFLWNCDNCVDSAFLYECKNCQSCFGCVNLRNKNYCFFNEQLTKEAYKEKIQAINLGNRDISNEYKEKFEDFLKENIRKNLQVDPKNVNCLGDDLWGAKDCYLVFRGYAIENVRYSTEVAFHTKDSADLYSVGTHVQLSYEAIEIVDSSNIKFSYFIRDGLDLEYCLECHNCQHCFGCIGLRNKKYHILNKPYSKEDYWQKLDEIKTKMLSIGEYGEFFSLSMAYAAYNDTYAIIEFLLAKKEVLENGWQWNDDEPNPDLKNLEVIKARDLPKDIKNVGDDILQKVILCEKTEKPFRLIKAELDFYRKHNLSLPILHPNIRILERLISRNPARLWKANCAKCQKEMDTSYPPEKQKEYKIYCRECYKEEFL